MPPSDLIFLSRLINLVFILLVGSVFKTLYVPLSSSNIFAFSWYSSLSIMTMATPLSAVRMTLHWSFLSSTSAWTSCFVIFLLGSYECLRVSLILALRSSALWGSSFMQACSIAVMYSPWGVPGSNSKIGAMHQ